MIANNYGPTLAISEQTHADKYRLPNESFYEAMCRIAGELKDTEEHRQALKGILLNMRFMPGGRVQAAIGAPRKTTPYNCFVSMIIPDSVDGICDAHKESMNTMRMGGGIGYDFSTLRPKGDHIKSLGSPSSGPVSFMQIFDAGCKTISSAGNRRGAQMGVLRCDHPDIGEFIRCKQNGESLTAFNISVGITDEFMEAVLADADFDLRWGGVVYETVNARSLWDEIMRSTYDWAEPGVLFLDRINEMNNLWYCEDITATNPCAEQPLPPHGACLLGSWNMTKYVTVKRNSSGSLERCIDYERLIQDIPHVVRMMDNVVDAAIYPLPEQEAEAKNKRRMGLGITGLANAVEAIGYPYGTPEFILETEKIMETLRDHCYRASIALATEKGPFPLFDRIDYCDGNFISTLPLDIRQDILEHGIRNSHLISIAPTGTISLCADYVSSGIEPVFAYSTNRTILTEDGPSVVTIEDYGIAKFDVYGARADDITVQYHLDVLLAVNKYVDSAVSKTCNVGADVTWEEFKQIYINAWKGGAKGCTTFRASGKRFGILNSNDEPKVEACFIDPETGTKTCD